MKKVKTAAMALLLILTAASFVYALFFSNPAVRIYQFGQNIDNGIADANLLLDMGREEILNLLQRDTADLIRIGSNYETGLNIEREMGHFQDSLAKLSAYVEKAVPRMDRIYERADFAAEARRATTLGRHQELAETFIVLQQTRLSNLQMFNGALVELHERLLEFETRFYEPDPWVSIPYFQSLLEQFDLLQMLHEEYADVVGDYIRAKTNFYLAIRENL